MLQSPPAARHQNASGFSLIELIVTVAIIGFLAAAATGVYMNQKNKAIESEIPTRVGETAMALELYKQRNLGSLANTSNPLTTNWLRANGVTESKMIATRVCVNWSNGVETPGEYTIYSYYVNTDTGQKVDSSKMYILDSGTSQSTAEVATSGQESQVCPTPLDASAPAASNLLSSGNLVWLPNQAVTIVDENGWKKATTAQSTSTPGVMVVSSFPVSSNSSYTFSVEGRKNSSGAAYLGIYSAAGNVIQWPGTALTTTNKRVSTTFNTGAHTTLRVYVLWSGPGSSSPTMWLKDPRLIKN